MSNTKYQTPINEQFESCLYCYIAVLLYCEFCNMSIPKTCKDYINKAKEKLKTERQFGMKVPCKFYKEFCDFSDNLCEQFYCVLDCKLGSVKYEPEDKIYFEFHRIIG